MHEFNILATSEKFLSHTWSQQPPVSLPPIWPPLPENIFIRISDKAVQSYFSGPISIEFAINLQQIQVYGKVAKPEEGRQGAAVTKCAKEFFSKWPNSLLVPKASEASDGDVLFLQEL